MVKTSTGAQRDTRAVLIEAGMKVMFEKGYTNTGIQEVLSSVGVPKGSFYHYFNSKEDFVIQIIKTVEEDYAKLLSSYMSDKTRSPLERIRNYCQTKKRDLLEQNCRRGCLIGNLSQEMADQSENLRTELARIMRHWRDIYAACIKEGQESGEISSIESADCLAEAFLCGWEGAIMRSKTQKNIEPLEAFIKVMVDRLLAGKLN